MFISITDLNIEPTDDSTYLTITSIDAMFQHQETMRFDKNTLIEYGKWIQVRFPDKKLYYGRVTVLSVFGCISGGQSCFFMRATRKLIGWRPAKTDKKVTLPYIKYNLHWSWRWQWFWWLSDYDSFKILMSICNIYFLIYVKGLFSLYWWLLLCN